MLIQEITNHNSYKINFPKFKGSAVKAPQTAQGADTFIKSAEQSVFVTIADIKNYLKQNADKILNGRIFNIPLTKDGDSLLMAFLHIKPIREEYEECKELLKQMAEMSEINYDQKDSMDMTALEWVMTTENAELLSLMKGQKLTQDPMLYNAYKNIKNPEFKKALLESGTYIPPVLETEEEQRVLVSSIINRKHNVIAYSVVNNVVNALCNNEKEIQNDMVVVFKKIIDLSSVWDIGELPEAIRLLKDDKGNVNTEKAAHFLASYSDKSHETLQSAARSVARTYKLTYQGIDYSPIGESSHYNNFNNPVSSNNRILQLFEMLVNINQQRSI